MKCLIDTQKNTLKAKLKQFPELVLGQLITPLTSYSDWKDVYAIDNGAYSGFNETEFLRLLSRQSNAKARCLWVSCPDIVGNARRTLEIWKHRDRWLNGWPTALVLQNGIENLDIPWSELDAVFIGGVDPWKESNACADIIKTAKTLQKKTHAGRVNTWARWKHFEDLGVDTCDGSGIAMYDHMLQTISNKQQEDKRPTLFDRKTLEAE